MGYGSLEKPVSVQLHAVTGGKVYPEGDKPNQCLFPRRGAYECPPITVRVLADLISGKVAAIGHITEARLCWPGCPISDIPCAARQQVEETLAAVKANSR